MNLFVESKKESPEKCENKENFGNFGIGISPFRNILITSAKKKKNALPCCSVPVLLLK